MGYCYTDDGKLCCDQCGTGGATERVCPVVVVTSILHSGREALPYCSAPALCAACYDSVKSVLHASCAAGAAKAQSRYDAEQERLDAGDLLPATRWGSWHPTVPFGMVGVLYRGLRACRYVLVPTQYGDSPLPLSAMPDAVAWDDHP